MTADGSTPLQRVTLLDALTSQVEEEILSGSLEVGSRLPSEEDLARRYGVSRPVVREALARLRERGLVETVTGSGTFVRSPAPADLSEALLRHLRMSTSGTHSIRNLYETRLGVEVTCARLAAERATAHDLSEIKRHIESMREASDRASVADADVGFHLAVARASHNPFLWALLSPLVHLIREVIIEVQQEPTAVADGIAGHERVLAALEAGDGEAAAEAMREHIAVSQRYSVARSPGERS